MLGRFVLGIALAIALAASAEAASVTLTWTDNSNNEEGFDVERKNAPCATAGTFSRIAGVSVNVTTFIDSTVANGQTYCYRVDAFAGTAKSAYSNTAEAAVPFLAPATPSNLGTTVTP